MECSLAGLVCDGVGVPFGRRGIFVCLVCEACLAFCASESMFGVSVGLDERSVRYVL